ncbi:MAG: DUF488 domain-containing protein [Planctomycetaceae bacterium]|nr:MAG: DUF488 domain-containing protein [Planctomycetaceae bacterium]
MTQQHDGQTVLFTIGHSTHEWSAFAALLQQHGVTAVADVRSSPFSRFTPQFNRDMLTQSLKNERIAYVFLGRELGARRSEPECYVDRQARYELIQQSPLFNEGLERLRGGLRDHRIALLCAEKDPITCHRMVLVCRALRGDPIVIQHILEDGTLESNAEAEKRMHKATGVPETALTAPPEDLIEEAYKRQGRKIAWVESEEPQSDVLTPSKFGE